MVLKRTNVIVPRTLPKREENFINFLSILRSFKYKRRFEGEVKSVRKETAKMQYRILIVVALMVLGLNLVSSAKYVGKLAVHNIHAKPGVRCSEPHFTRVAIFKNGTRYVLRQGEHFDDFAHLDGCFIPTEPMSMLQCDDKDYQKYVIMRDTSIYLVQKGVNADYFGNSAFVPLLSPEIIDNPQVAACVVDIPLAEVIDTSGKKKWFCEWC